LSGGQLPSYVEGRSALDFPLIHDARLQDTPYNEVNNIKRLKFYHSIRGSLGFLGCRISRRLQVQDHQDQPGTVAATTKATQLLGWEVQVGVEEGIRRLIAWAEGRHAP
jgi:hypothetical protein